MIKHLLSYNNVLSHFFVEQIKKGDTNVSCAGNLKGISIWRKCKLNAIAQEHLRTVIYSPDQLFGEKWHLYANKRSISNAVPNVLMMFDINSVAMVTFWDVIFLPLWLKSPSISMDDLEWAMQSMEQGTMPSWAGERSVVRTRHQSGLSWSRSRTSTVWPRRTDSSPLLPLLATKSWITTVNSQPPESCKGSKRTGRWSRLTWKA